jgi:hypothetical protein
MQSILKEIVLTNIITTNHFDKYDLNICYKFFYQLGIDEKEYIDAFDVSQIVMDYIDDNEWDYYKSIDPYYINEKYVSLYKNITFEILCITYDFEYKYNYFELTKSMRLEKEQRNRVKQRKEINDDYNKMCC